MYDRNKLMVILEGDFQRNLFTNFLKRYGLKRGCYLLRKSCGMLYHYRNHRVRAIPLELVKKVTKLTNTPRDLLDNSIIKITSEGTRRKLYLDIGRRLRRVQFTNFRNNIPKISELVDEGNLNVEEWFKEYLKLINWGARQFKEVKICGNKIRLKYTNYSIYSKKKVFINYLPRIIKLDEEFQYFFGLWCGDRAGRGRFGVANKNKTINFVTSNYLKKLLQIPRFILLYHQGIKKPHLDYKINEVYKIKSPRKGYSVCVAVTNSVFFTFFDYLLKNLEDFLRLIPNKNIFLAGLFDAEGNVFWEDRCFRWSCKNERLVEIYAKYLKELDLFDRYDGSNIVAYNMLAFRDYILPFLKHPDKINKASLLCHGRGNLDKRFLNILKTVEENNGSKNKDLTKVLKRAKVYSQLKFLEDFGYIYKKGYPHKNYVAMKGLKELQRGEGQ